jgi:hypothetical protein
MLAAVAVPVGFTPGSIDSRCCGTEDGEMRFICIVFCAVAFLMLGFARTAHAAITASASYTGNQISPGVFEYSITLQNTGTTNIGTFWFGWVVYPPIYDLLPNIPTNVSSPAGWAGQGLNDSIYGGYSAEWTTTTSPLGPGQLLSGFKFDSIDPPEVMRDISPVFPVFRADTSWVYIGLSQGDPGFRFQPTQFVPEPGAGCALITSVALLMRRRRATIVGDARRG